MLAESHISIHTWPEKGMAVCDAFTCGDTHRHLKKGVEYMQKMLEGNGHRYQEFIRPLE
jgi:S-adenosylmethionine decarboxylase